MKQISKVVSSLSLAAVMSLQCAAGVFAETTDGIISDDVKSNVIPDYSISAPTDMTQDFVNEYDIDSLTSEQMEYYAKLPAETVTGVSPIAGGLVELTVTDDSGFDHDAFEAEKKKLLEEAKKSDSDAIFAETKDANYLTYSYTNDYFYKQLDSKLKGLYNDLYEWCEYLMFHDYDITETVNAGEDKYYFIDYIDYSGMGYSDDEMMAFVHAFMYSNPHFFFLGTYGTDTLYDRVFFITYDDYQDGDTRINAAKKINSIAGSWLTEINQGKDLLEKESLLYKKMSNWITYQWQKNSDGSYKVDDDGYGIYGDSGTWSHQTMAGALLKKTCVCAGYSRTFVYFCHLLGIEAIGITSTGHAWNMVKLYDTWYEIDVDAMDKIKEVDFVPNSSYTAYERVYYDNIIAYTYCNVGENVLGGSSHDIEDFYSKLYKLPDRSASYEQPIHIYSRVDNAVDGQATFYWENMNKWDYVYYPMGYAFYTYLDGKYTCVGSIDSVSTNYGSYTFKNLKNGVKYGFLVRTKIWNPVIEKYVWTGFTSANVVYATPVDTSKPKITSVEVGSGKVGLNWTSVSGASKYAVYVNSGSGWNCAGTRTALGMYVDGLTNGVKYGFAVKAYVNGKWTEVTSSDIVYATPVGTSKPKITSVEVGNGKVRLNWTSVSGASKYAVYVNSGSGWNCAGTRTALGMYVDGLTNGVKYGFAVKAYVNGKWTEVTSSDIVYATPVDTSKPKITSVEIGNGKVGLNWTKVSGASKYAVYVTSGNGWNCAGTRTALGMYVDGLTNGVKYGFAVKAYVNGKWTEVTSSDIVYATPSK